MPQVSVQVRVAGLGLLGTKMLFLPAGPCLRLGRAALVLPTTPALAECDTDRPRLLCCRCRVGFRSGRKRVGLIPCAGLTLHAFAGFRLSQPHKASRASVPQTRLHVSFPLGAGHFRDTEAGVILFTLSFFLLFTSGTTESKDWGLSVFDDQCWPKTLNSELTLNSEPYIPYNLRPQTRGIECKVLYAS